jgi:hypothetical protein
VYIDKGRGFPVGYAFCDYHFTGQTDVAGDAQLGLHMASLQYGIQHGLISIRRFYEELRFFMACRALFNFF